MTKSIGKYQVLDELGRGGFATVYLALDSRLEREVALKELDSLLLRDAGWVQRFFREARAAARLVHPHIVTIFEVDQVEGSLFIAMQLASGGSLADQLKKQGALAWPQALQVLAEVAAALDYAHSQGVVHRDLKPANVLLDENGAALLTDFGFASIVGENSVSLSMAGGLLGTPSYMAPEIWEGQAAQASSDVYALGCILHEMLTGEMLFGGNSPLVIARAHDRGPKLPQAWPDGVPEGVSEVLTQALARDMGERPQSAGALVAALRDAETQRVSPVAAPPPQARRTPTARGGTQTLELARGVTMEFVHVPAGEFLMGSAEGEGSSDERPQHTVYLDAYYIGKYPVTNVQYQVFVQATGHEEPYDWHDGAYPKGKENHPVVEVSWRDAAAFCQWATDVTGRSLFLPTEAEWEKAARGTDGRRYPWGEQAPTPRHCNFDEQVGDTTPVGRYSPQGDSPYGCCDMAGNVWEWVTDWYDADYYAKSPRENPSGPSSGDYRVLRGGSWIYDDGNVRAADRDSHNPDYWDDDVGFRCARSSQ
jgi:formylglycine-generating enzyme required for sulfatase activity